MFIDDWKTATPRRTRLRGSFHRLSAGLREFLTNAFGSLFTIEFLRVALPLLILWDLLPRLEIVPPSLVPGPLKVAAAFGELLEKGLVRHVLESYGRLALGLALGITSGFLIGTLMGWNIYVRKHLLPLFQLLAPVPPPAWVPITIILLGVGLPMQSFLIFLGVFYPVLFNTYQGVKETDPRYIASARVFGASELTILRKVCIPSALGSVIMGIKIGISMGLVMLVIAEMHGGRSGIGFLLVESKEFFQIDRMVACMVLLGATGWFLIEIMKYLELRLAQWKKGR